MFDLYINDNYQNTIESDLIPRIGDTIEYDDKEYTVRKVIFVVGTYLNRILHYQVHVSNH